VNYIVHRTLDLIVQPGFWFHLIIFGIGLSLMINKPEKAWAARLGTILFVIAVFNVFFRITFH
jgi:hypothetical protein